jgi:integrase/recombinase XerD
MKKLPLNTPQYKQLEQSFKDWLETLGYSKSSVEGIPAYLREFLHWLEENDITAIDQVKEKHGQQYIEYFKNRKNHRRGGGVSIAHINSHIDMLNKLSYYLKRTGRADLSVNIPYLKDEGPPDRTVLTIGEIKSLYQATDDTPLGMRDRAMLAVYYGCGLRKSEGLRLTVDDVLFERRLVYVRQSKTNYQRHVPIGKTALKHLEEYIHQGRPLQLSEQSREKALFISERGRALKSGGMANRLQILRREAGIDKQFGLHALRHSIATHLLEAGMELENIALFLGHKTLDSTQLYTHLVNEKT